MLSGDKQPDTITNTQYTMYITLTFEKSWENSSFLTSDMTVSFSNSDRKVSSKGM